MHASTITANPLNKHWAIHKPADWYEGYRYALMDLANRIALYLMAHFSAAGFMGVS